MFQDITQTESFKDRRQQQNVTKRGGDEEMISPAIPQTGLSVIQAERLLGLPRRVGYRKIKQGKLCTFRDSQGILKITKAEIYRYIREEQ